MPRKRKNTGPKPRTYALVRGATGRPMPQVRELTRKQADGALRDHNQRKRGSQTNWRVVPDARLDQAPRGRGGLAGTGDAATRRAKREEAVKRQRDREYQRSRRRGGP